MNTKTIFGTVAGGVAFFISGWLIYGLLLQNLMTQEDTNGIMKKEEDYVWWALVLSNLVWAYLVTWIIQLKSSFGLVNGLKTGFWIGLITGLAYDLGLFAMSHMFKSFQDVLFDVLANSLLFTIAGAVIGLVAGKQEKTEENKTV